MFCFYYSQDFFALKEAVEKKRAAFFKSNPSAVASRFNLDEEEGFQGLKQALETKSLFGEVKFVVASNCFSDNLTAQKLLETLKSYIQNPDKNIFPVFCQTSSSGELSKKNRELFNFLLKKSTESREVLSPKGYGLQKWASPDTAVSNFDLTDAVASKNRQKAVLVLDKLLSQGEDPQAILGLMIYQFRVLLRIKALVKKAVPYGDLAKAADLHPFVVKKSYTQIKKFELDELQKIFNRLSFLDQASKNGILDLSAGLFMLLLEI